MELENIILSVVTDTKEHTWHVFPDKGIFALKFTMPMIQNADLIELKEG